MTTTTKETPFSVWLAILIPVTLFPLVVAGASFFILSWLGVPPALAGFIGGWLGHSAFGQIRKSARVVLIRQGYNVKPE